MGMSVWVVLLVQGLGYIDMDLQTVSDAQEVSQMQSHKILDTFAFGLIATSIFGYLEQHTALFVSISAIIGAGLGLYRWYLAYRESAEHLEDRAEKKAQAIISNAKIRGIEHLAMTDEEILKKAEQIQIRANGKYQHPTKEKK